MGMNLKQTHCLALRAPTLDFLLAIIKIRKFVIQGFLCVTRFEIQITTSLQAKKLHNMANRRQLLLQKVFHIIQ
jgi:hypothetical protein